MAPFLPDLDAHAVIVGLPELAAEELVPACEVLCQEGFRLWAVAAAELVELPALLRLFGRRARIGVHGVTTPEQVVAAQSAGAAFAASDFCLPALVAAAPGFPVVLGGLTPSELHQGLRAGAAAVQVTPLEAFGTAYVRVLPDLLAPGPVVASGRVERYQAELWWEAGGIAVWPRDLVAREVVLGENLDELRATLQQWLRHG